MQPSTRGAAADMQLLALSIALNHPALSSDEKLLCAAARACRGWRAAVQECSACNISVTVSSSTSLVTLASLVNWLSSHAGLVRSITANINLIDTAKIHDVPVPQYRAAAQLMLQQTLRLLAAKADAVGRTTHAATADSLRLRLAEFRSNHLASPAVLQALPSHSLTRLELGLDQSGLVSAPAMAAALAELSKLQQLVLTSRDEERAAPVACLAGLRPLTQMTSLRLEGSWVEGLRKQLAQPLPLRQLSLQLCERWRMRLDLTSLTCLEKLEANNCLLDRTVLPAQLQQLTMVAYKGATLSPVAGLQSLQQLSLTVELVDPQQLLLLAQLPVLQTLALSYENTHALLATAPTWRALSQLRALCISYDDNELPTPEEFAGVLSAAAACSSVTSLSLWVSYAQLDEDEHGEEVRRVIPVSSHLAGMTGLRDLGLYTLLDMLPGDVTALTSLTGLTRLDLELAQDGQLQDFDVALLAGSLKQLRHLSLRRSKLRSMVCLASIAQLTHLTALNIEDNPGVTAQGLMALTRLKQLQQLLVSKSAEVTDAVLSSFWRAVPAVTCLCSPY